MKEEWREIKGYEGFYDVSNKGRVRSYPRSGTPTLTIKIAKQWVHKGYYRVALWRNNKGVQCSPHLLVWDTFGDEPRNGRILQVDHIDENKLNNSIKNLQLLAARDNLRKSKKYHKEEGVPVGVHWDKVSKKYRLQLQENNIKRHYGRFSDLQSAIKKYQEVTGDVNV